MTALRCFNVRKWLVCRAPGAYSPFMTHDKGWYKAYAARDARFDGVFFVGVTSTGIYCRPVCPARTARESNCRFFSLAAAAEKSGFRPCLRCRPELAPGWAPVDDAKRIGPAIAKRLSDLTVDSDAALADLAASFDLSPRQIRRILRRELGVSPIELIQTRRLLLAKQLLTETALSITDIAFASGFGSLRRFNDAFLKRYRLSPSQFRRHGAATALAPAKDASTLRLSYRAPYDWDGILAFLSARLLQGAEWVDGGSYFRTVCISGHTGWIRVSHAPQESCLTLTFSHSLLPALPAVVARLRNLFDLDARPDLIAEALAKDKLLRAAVRKNPGLRVPGAFDPFELSLRAILGQQVTVKAATTLSCRFIAAFGDRIATPFPALTHLAPTPQRLQGVDVGAIAGLGIVGARAASIQALARGILAGDLTLDGHVPPKAVMDQLTALPGIGPWTAHYIAMRALRWPDAFPKEDLALRQRLGNLTAREAETRSQVWRPWRSYAVLHLWNMPKK
jgi:AraC family transcriptional regulator of adaptative response / DNA-3-methyladenine glycosylase II